MGSGDNHYFGFDVWDFWFFISFLQRSWPRQSGHERQQHLPHDGHSQQGLIFLVFTLLQWQLWRLNLSEHFCLSTLADLVPRWTCLTWPLSWAPTFASSMYRLTLRTKTLDIRMQDWNSGSFTVDCGGLPCPHRDVLPHSQHRPGHLLAGHTQFVSVFVSLFAALTVGTLCFVFVWESARTPVCYQPRPLSRHLDLVFICLPYSVY